MTTIIRIVNTETDAVNSGGATSFEMKGYPWTARIVADVPVYVLVGIDAVATVEDAYVNEFDDHTMFSIGADEDVSVLGTDVGTVWVSEVRKSS